MAVFNLNDDITLAYLLKKTKESTLNVLNKAIENINGAIDVINNTITEITTNMPAWIDVNISYVSGETVEDKVARLLTGTYLPRGRPFIGRVRSGSYFFVAGHLYISSDKLYGAMVFNGIGSDQGGLYGIYDSTIYKQSIRPEDVVKKFGDTMTGGLIISPNSTPFLYLDNDLADTSLATDSATRIWSLYNRDKYNRVASYLETSFNTNGRSRLTIAARRYSNGANFDNALVLDANADSTRSVSVTSPGAWRSALGAVNKAGDTMTGTLTSTPGSGVTYIAGARGDGAGLYVKKGSLNADQYIPALVLQTKAGGSWAIGNYSSEVLTLVYATKANIDSQKNTIFQVAIDTSGNYSGKAANVTGTVAIANGGTSATGTTKTTTISSIATAAANMQITSASYSVWGKLAQFNIALKATAAISSGAALCTLASGKRPSELMSIIDSNGYLATFSTNGVINLWHAYAANATFSVRATYLLP